MWDNSEPNIDLSDSVIEIDGLRDDEATIPFTSSPDAEATVEAVPFDAVVPVEPAVSGAFATLDSLERIFDFQVSEETFAFGAAATDFATIEALDYAHAYADVSNLMAGDQADYVAVQFGDDVLLFADVGDTDAIGAAVVLVGRSFSDLGLGVLG